MALFTYSKDARSALRSAVTSHAGWDSYRTARGLSSSSLSVDELEAAAQAFGIDLAQYGSTGRKRRFGSYVPQPRTVTVESLKPVFYELAYMLTDPQRDYAADIFADGEKHGGMITEKQAFVIRDMINKAAARSASGAPVTSAAPAAEPIPAAAPAPSSVNPMPTGGLSPDVLLEMLRDLLARGAAPAALDEGRIIDLIKQHAGTPAHVTIDLRTPAGIEPLGEELVHHKLPLVMAGVRAGVPLFLSGDAGAGKTTMCKQIARLLKRDFFFTGAINSEYKLTGFIDAQGRIVSTAFIRAFKEGGVFLFDEIDGSLPAAVLPFNAAVANRMADLPEGIVEAHPDFVAIAAGNTTGRGADRLYVGRMQQDAAVLDRYAIVNVDIDEALEAAFVGAPRPLSAPLPATVTPITDAKMAQLTAAQWVERVRKCRAAAQRHKLRHIVSPRATLNGSKLLAAGWSWSEVEEACLYKGIDADARAKLAA
jgi:hypothetical protein